MSAPRVSVVMAVRDGEPYLAEAVESLLAQTFADFELVVVDDGSSDASRDVVRSYRDPRVRLLENGRNRGLAASLNRGIREARGELLARQDADDVSEPERLARQVAHLDAHPEVALLGSWFREIDSRGGHLRDGQLPCEPVDVCWRLLFVCPFVHSAVMLRRDAVPGGSGPYDERLAYAMDYELWCRIARRHPVANLPEYLVRYRMHPGSMTSAGGERTAEGDRLHAALFGELLGLPPGEPGLEARHAAVAGLVRGLGQELTGAEIRRAGADLAALHPAFCERFGVRGVDRAGHWTSVREGFARSVLRAAASLAARGDVRGALRAARAAATLHPRSLLRREVGRALRRLLLPAREAAAGGGRAA